MAKHAGGPCSIPEISKWSLTKMVPILVPKRTDSETFPGHPTGRAHSGWPAAWLGGWGRLAGHMGCMLFIQVGVAHKRFRAAKLAQSAPCGSPWPSMLESNGFSEWGRPAGHMWCMLFIQVGVAHNRSRAGRLAQSALWGSPWRSMLEDHAQYLKFQKGR